MEAARKSLREGMGDSPFAKVSLEKPFSRLRSGGIAVLLIAGTVLVSLSAAMAAPLQIYVAPNGNDNWSGRSAEARAPDGPFATLIRARDELRRLKAQGGLPDGAVVNVLSGTYYLDEPLVLTAEDSGAENAPIVYRGVGREKPVLRGGRVLKGFRPYKGQVLQADLAAAGLGGKRFRQLFFRGERMVLARYPNFDPGDPHGGTWAYVARVEGDSNHREFFYGEDETHQWAHPEEGEVAIFSGYDWAFSRVPIASHLPDQRKIVLAANTWCPMRIGDRYYVQGLFEELDTPGEWYLDARTDTLYFWPPADIAESEVVVPVVDNVVRMDGAAHITLRGFVIEMCEGDAVLIRNSSHCLVAGCVVRNCGAWGINITGGEYSGAKGNDVYWCGHGGISVGGGDRKTLTPAHNFADNNYIHHCANVWLTYRPGLSVWGVGNTISHNLVHDMPHAGILLGGNENVVEYNIVHHVNLQSADTGGIYFCSRDWTQRGNVIRFNIFHHCGGFGKVNSWAPIQGGKVPFHYPGFTWGIYLDDPTTGTLVYGNILWAVPICALHNHGGRDNTFENNIIVDAPAIAENALDPNWSEWKAIYQRLHEVRYEGSPYLQRYPELANYADTHPEEMSGVRFLRNIIYYTVEGTAWIRGQNAGGWGGPNAMRLYSVYMRPEDFGRNEWDYNCIYAEAGLDLQVSLSLWGQPGRQATWDEWRALGKDAHSILADPGFLDPANHDYRLKPDSPALALGFKPIPVEQIGPYEDDLRASWPIVEAPGAAALGEFTTLRYYQPPQYRPVEAREFSPRGGLGNFFAKLGAAKPVKVAYFGGGVDGPGGWRARVIRWIADRYGEVQEIDASICDCVRSSAFSVYRFAHDVLAHQPDLVLIDFVALDRESDPSECMKALEGVIRQAWKADPSLDVVLVYGFLPGFEKDYADGVCPANVSAFERVANHYAVPSVNMGLRVARLHSEGKLLIAGTPEQAAAEGKLLFSARGIWPSDDANTIYAQAIIEALEQLSRAPRAVPHHLPEPLDPGNYERATQVAISRDMLQGDWRELGPDDPLRRQFAKHFDTIWFTNSPGAKLSFRFRGTAASLFDLMGPDTGVARVTVDGKDLGTRVRVDRWAYYHRLSALHIASGLEDAEHTATIELLPTPPDRSVAIEAAKQAGRYEPGAFEGVALRVGWIRVIGEVLGP